VWPPNHRRRGRVGLDTLTIIAAIHGSGDQVRHLIRKRCLDITAGPPHPDSRTRFINRVRHRVLRRSGSAVQNMHMPQPAKDGRPGSSTRTRRPESEPMSYASTPGVRSRMQVQRTRDTAPEVAIRRLLHADGLRYRVDRAPLKTVRRRADIVFGPAQVAVFIDGCFWHGCPDHSTPRTIANPEYWAQKIARNRARDSDTDRRLGEADWTVVRAWEHEDAASVVARIASVIRSSMRVSAAPTRLNALSVPSSAATT
jgi:DNA mismatch endonuclease (patch repair protein)